MEEVGALLFRIPARSPDCNPIENVFNLVNVQLEKEALQKHITRENFDEFSKRVKRTIKNFPAHIIDKTIESMPKRMHQIVKKRGGRLKY